MSNAVVSVLLMLALHFTVTARGLGQQSDSAGNDRRGESEQAIVRLERDAAVALRQGDVARLEQLWAPEFRFIAPNGLTVTRDAYLSMIKGQAVAYDRLELQQVRVQVFGDAAIVTGRFDVTGRAMGQIVDGVDDYLTMYVKREGRWQQVATHALRVPGSTRSQGAAVAEGNRRPINA